MKKLKLLIVFSVIFISCNHTGKLNQKKIESKSVSGNELMVELNISDSLPIFLQKKTTTTIAQISPSTIKPSYNISYEGKIFTLVGDENNKIVFISTTDSSFITKEDVKIGMKLKECKKTTKYPLHYSKGWGYILPLSSGWNAFFEMRDCNKGIKNSDSKVTFIFKSKYYSPVQPDMLH